MNDEVNKSKHLALTKLFKPIASFSIIVVSVCIISWFLSPVLFHLFPADSIAEKSAGVYELTIGSGKYILRWTIWIILVFVGLNLLMMFLDLLFRGTLISRVIGRFFGWGIPAFGVVLEELGQWYENPQAKRRQHSDRFELLEDVDLKHPFANWMAYDINPRFENNVQAMAYIGAAILIGLIGLRGINFIPRNEPTLILIGLELEFTLLLLLGFVLFFKPEERSLRKPPPDGYVSKEEFDKVKAEVEDYRSALRDVRATVAEHSKRLGLTK